MKYFNMLICSCLMVLSFTDISGQDVSFVSEYMSGGGAEMQAQCPKCGRNYIVGTHHKCPA